jgi:(2Fe-2S) ferredoxin
MGAEPTVVVRRSRHLYENREPEFPERLDAYLEARRHTARATEAG